MKKLIEIYRKETPVVIKFDGEEIPAVAKLNALSSQEVEAMGDINADMKVLADSLTKFYSKIDISLGDSEESMEITKENLLQFPPALLRAAVETLFQAIADQKKKLKKSIFCFVLLSGEIERIGGDDFSQEPPPDFYFEIQAAQTLGMSFVDLRSHPEKKELMEMWAIYQAGKNEGEMEQLYLTEYWKRVKTHTDKIRQAQEAAGFNK